MHREHEDRNPGRILLLSALLFTASGFTALVYEVAWERMLGIFSGVHLYSITLIVAAYMAGLGFGSLCGGRLADRLRRRAAIVAFAACETGIGLFALISPWIYYDLTTSLLAPLARYPALLPALHFLLLLPPTLLMGASLPLLSRGLVRRTATAAGSIAVLYGCNTVGAALGALVTTWLLLGSYGLAGSVRLAALANLVIGAGALWLARRVAESDRRAPSTTDGHVARPPGRVFGFGAWCAIYGFSGFLALSLEIVWFRTLGVTIKTSSWSFGHILGLFLLMLGLGSLAGSPVARRLGRPDLVFLWGQWLASALAVLAVVLLVRAPLEWVGLDQLEVFWHRSRAAEIFDLIHALEHPDPRRTPHVVSRFVQIFLGLPLFLLGLPTFILGVTFGALQKAVQTDLRQIGRRVGTLYASNILGAIVGSLVTGTLFLEFLGTPGTWTLLSLAGTVFSLLALARHRRAVSRGLAASATAAGVALALAVPGAAPFWARLHGETVETLLAEEDATGVVAWQALDPGIHLFKVNGRTHGFLPYGDERTLYGLMPILLRPEARHAAVIGLGPGNTAWALLLGPSLERLDLFELVRPEPSVLRRSRFRNGGYAPIRLLLDDPRLRLRFADGRLALRASAERYDLIEADTAHPSMAYSGNLYSREFFELARSRLEPGGLFCSMAPTERTLRTMVAVFPHVLDFHAPSTPSFVIGANEPLRFDAREILAAFDDERIRRLLFAAGELDATRAMLERYLAEAQVRAITGDDRSSYVGDVNTDLFPADEFDLRYDGTYR